jgi:thiol-disulfide isomerase/thioredoxin
MAALERAWPGHPEWLAMLVDILQGSQLGPYDGWFRKAVSQSRYGWETTQSLFDANGDHSIARDEFPGSDDDFATIDRDGSRVIDPPDFNPSPHALAPSPGMMLFMRADRNGNGKLTPDELAGLAKMLDKDGAGYVSLDEMKAFLTMPTTGGGRPPASQPRTSSDGPSRATLVRGLFRQEIGSLQPGPAIGDQAPDFTLKTADGSGALTLSEQLQPGKPVVLVFGNFTCGPFRSQAGNVEKLYHKYKDRATFVMVYVREAHPKDGWSMESNDRVGVALPQPTTYNERADVAQQCGRLLDLSFPMLVDTMDDAVGARYSGMPGRLYLIDPERKVAYKSGRGPFGFKTAELEQALLIHLAAAASQPSCCDDPADTTSAAAPTTAARP